MTSGGEGGQDFDLNLAPIIDCFTVLITYLLVSASFLTLNMLEVGVAAVGAGAAPTSAPKEPPFSLTLTLVAQKEATLKLTGGKDNLNQSFRVVAGREGWDFKAIRQKLQELKARWPGIGDLTVSAEPTVPYRELVKLVEAAKPVFAKVYLSGQ